MRTPPRDSHTHRYTRTRPSTPAATCRNTALPTARRSPSSSDTAPRGPMSVEVSRHSQNTQDLVGAKTPRLHDACLPRGGSPFRGAGGGRKQPGQSSALSPSNSADSESRHLPLTEPQTLPCTPGPPPGLADDAPCQSLLQEGPLVHAGRSPELCCGHRPVPVPAHQARRGGGVRSGVLGCRGAAAGPVVIAWQPEAHPIRAPSKP